MVGAVLGFGPSDLQGGGRLQRFNIMPDANFYARDLAAQLEGDPASAITFRRSALAEGLRLQRERQAAGFSDAYAYADEVLQRRAMRMLLESPFRSIATMLPFLWRGASVPLALLLVACLTAVRRRRSDLIFFSLPALGLLAFYGLFSHFILRYGVPAIPVGIAASLAAAHIGWRGRTKGKSELPEPVPADHRKTVTR
jgi:hypothetical protein